MIFLFGQSFDCNSLKTIVKGGRKLSTLISICSGKVLASRIWQWVFFFENNVKFDLVKWFFLFRPEFWLQVMENYFYRWKIIIGFDFYLFGVSFCIKNLTIWVFFIENNVIAAIWQFLMIFLFRARVLIAIHWKLLLKEEENCRLWFLFVRGKVLASRKWSEKCIFVFQQRKQQLQPEKIHLQLSVAPVGGALKPFYALTSSVSWSVFSPSLVFVNKVGCLYNTSFSS